MTFGIDIATTQRNINMVQARNEGVEFAIVKMGGLNITPQYVAPFYHAEVDRVLDAGVKLGHYYLIGRNQSPEQQADYFVDNLYRFNVNTDVLALDDENLDDNGTVWGPGDAARFVRRVIQRTGIAAKRVWVYAGAADFRRYGPWTEVADTGARFWWAAYGNFPTGHTPDHVPNIQNSMANLPAVHQFSSRGAVAGYALDVNYSTLSIDDLFGGAVAPAQNTPPVPVNVPAASGSNFNIAAADQARIQRALKARGRYAGPIDGVWGPNTIKGIQTTIKNVGYTGSVDGIPGPLTCYYVQVYAQKFGGYTGPLDRILGPKSWAGFALGLERP
jgi:GH25 family lysozyme M1 (1,4-beta-N-acetylmuramidase)